MSQEPVEFGEGWIIPKKKSLTKRLIKIALLIALAALAFNLGRVSVPKVVISPHCTGNGEFILPNIKPKQKYDI